MKKQNKWTKSSWRSFPAQQQPLWPDSNVCEDTLKNLSHLPALVFAGESRSLKQDLAEVLEGKAFVLQAGECSEDFSRCHGPYIHNLLKVILQMSVIITYAGERKVVKIGRIAGQYAKPRSFDTEKIGKTIVPSYRGDMVNSPEPTMEARMPDPNRILEGYFRATATLNLVRAFTTGGYAALDQVHAWSEASVKAFSANPKYEELVSGIKKAIAFMDAIGIKSSNPQLNQVSLYTSHEALLLEYEEAMTRIDTTTGDWYDTSANMLWIGDRTRQPDGAHVEFMRGVCNPLGVKIGPGYVIDDIKRIAARLNPDNETGRLTMITRLGAEKINYLLPPLLREMKKEGFNVVWVCDPMHGNTYINRRSQKTRKYRDILKEIVKFWQIHQAEGTIAGGVHLELTGDDVTECTGGSRRLHDNDLRLNYQTNCDPRLNAEQAVELAFELATIINPS
ncbi:MAG: 3-deoxy-7-phosphoheptulonate synthase class II [Deltaproteobacteria bacterium]|nr:3-deoxy-7-phosphoheptulonate synthase class II [Deltaproteobacteria bacterium]